MQRYFIDDQALVGNTITIKDENAKHIAAVMRMEIDDEIICVHQESIVYLCKIVAISKNEVIAQTIKELESESELPIHVTIASGLPKGDKLEYVIQKGTELGAYSFIPLKMERSIVKWDDKKGEKKLIRWQKIAKEAAEQSHRHKIPQIEKPITIKDLIQNSQSFTKKVIAYEDISNNENTFKKVIQSVNQGESILIVFGPEGGISKDELAKLMDANFTPCRLGPRVLRTETAPLYALSAISYEKEE